jgi:hypothetical protein
MMEKRCGPPRKKERHGSPDIEDIPNTGSGSELDWTDPGSDT